MNPQKAYVISAKAYPHFFFFFFIFLFYFIFRLYITVLVLPNIKMNVISAKVSDMSKPRFKRWRNSF